MVKSYSIFRVTVFVLKLIVEVRCAATGRRSRFRIGEESIRGGSKKVSCNTENIVTCWGGNVNIN